MLKRVHIAIGTGLALAAAGPAVALEYCVTCEGPPAMYRCVVAGTEDGPGRDASVSLYCISQMAAKGGHQTCAVSRGAPFPCPGLTAVIEQPRDLPTLAAPQTGVPADAATTDEIDTAAVPAPEEPAPVPRTMEELAGQTVKSSKQGLQKAGEAIGGTAKKAGEQIGNAGSAIGTAASQTWNCITSLFSACGGDAAPESGPDDAPLAN